MKKTVNERQLKQIISEAVNRILNEDYCWYGDTKPFETIIKCCNMIMESSNFNNPDYEGDDDDSAAWHIYEWARKTVSDADDYILCNSKNVPINGGENW